MCQILFFNTVADLSPATLLKKRLWHRCFPVNFAKFLRTPFRKNTSGRLLLSKRFVPSEVFYKKGVLKKIQQFTGKRLFQSLSLNNVASLIKKHRCFPVNLAKLSRIFILHNSIFTVFFISV